MSFKVYNAYYGRAEKAKNSDKIREAKEFYLLAGRSLLEWALEVEGEDQVKLINRAKNIAGYARTLALPASAPAPVKKDTKDIIKENSQPDKSGKKSEYTSQPKERDGEETKFIAAEIPDIGFDDVAGLAEVKEAIRRRVIDPAKHPEIYERFKKQTGGGVLMYGPPGTGKTMIAKAIAKEVGATFYSIRCSDIVSKWFGEAEKNIKELFDTARKDENAVIFFDEFESLAPKRGNNSSVMPRVVAELLSQMQGFSESKNTLLLLAATNRPWDIDSAFLRPGRFGELIYIPLPDFEARKCIITKKFEDIPIEDGIDYDEMAWRMEGFNGSDVAEFCDRSSDYVTKRCSEIEEQGGYSGNEIVTKEDIEMTFENFKGSVQSQDLTKLEKFREEIGI